MSQSCVEREKNKNQQKKKKPNHRSSKLLVIVTLFAYRYDGNRVEICYQSQVLPTHSVIFMIKIPTFQQTHQYHQNQTHNISVFGTPNLPRPNKISPSWGSSMNHRLFSWTGGVCPDDVACKNNGCRKYSEASFYCEHGLIDHDHKDQINIKMNQHLYESTSLWTNIFMNQHIEYYHIGLVAIIVLVVDLLSHCWFGSANCWCFSTVALEKPHDCELVGVDLALNLVAMRACVWLWERVCACVRVCVYVRVCVWFFW